MGGPVFAVGLAGKRRCVQQQMTTLNFQHARGASGLILDTLVGPVTGGASVGFDGAFRIFVGVGRLMR